MGAFVIIKPVLCDGLDGFSAHVLWSNKSVPNRKDLLIAQGDVPPLSSVHEVWSNKSVPNCKDLLIAQGDIPPLGSVRALMYELLKQGASTGSQWQGLRSASPKPLSRGPYETGRARGSCEILYRILRKL